MGLAKRLGKFVVDRALDRVADSVFEASLVSTIAMPIVISASIGDLVERVNAIKLTKKEKSQIVAVGISNKQCEHMPLENLVNHFQKQGFAYMTFGTIPDVDWNNNQEEHTVDRVFINDKDIFNDDTEYTRDAKIRIIYHEVKSCKLPIEMKKPQKYQVLDMILKLHDKGFYNIEIENMPQLKKYGYKKIGFIDRIYVDNKRELNFDNQYRLSSRIKIYYLDADTSEHTKKYYYGIYDSLEDYDKKGHNDENSDTLIDTDTANKSENRKVRKCSACDNTIEADAIFCSKCGCRLS